MANIYVSPTGNDGSGDGSSGNPYEHIHHAIDQITSDGDVIICKDGTYDEEVGRTVSYNVTIKSDSVDYTKVIIKPYTLQILNGFGTFWNPTSGKTLTLQNVIILFKQSFLSNPQFSNYCLYPSNDSKIVCDYVFTSGDNGDTYIMGFIRDYFQSGSDVDLYKCTIRNFDYGLRTVRDIILYDTIFENVTTIVSFSAYGTYIGDYNCFYNYTTIGLTTNTNDITTNPSFTGTSDEPDINASSSCYDAGTIVVGHVTTYQGDAPDIGVYEVLLGETINVEENIEVSDENNLNVSKETISINESIELNESNELISGALDIQENLSITDSLYTEINRIDVEENVVLDDNNELSNQGTIEYASKILSRNPLLIALNTNPAKIAEINISDPENPTWSVYTIVGCSNANNITYNSETGYLYVFCDDGQLSKILATNLNSQTLIDTLDVNNLDLSTIIETKFKNYAVTDDVNGEIITIDEASFENINLDIRYLKQYTNFIHLQINNIHASFINTDIRYAKQSTSFISLDIRFLKYNYDEISQNPIDYDDIQVKINGIDLCPLNDVDLKSIIITHTESQQTTASFNLHRRFDDLDRDYNGNNSQITNNNVVKIYINGNLEFDGKVSGISPESESEIIQVNALMDEPDDARFLVNIPLASVNEPIHLYHCLTQSISVDKPYINSALYETDKVYGSGSVDLKLTPPPYYKGVKYDRGTQITQRVSRYSALSNVASGIIDGSFKPKQNWSYFWLASLKYLATNGIFGSTSTTNSRYIGSSLSPISSDVIELISAYYKYQKIYENKESYLGYSYIGEAPYMEVPGPNGALNPVERWEDMDDGLYNVKDNYYNNLSIIYKIGQLEYAKLKNINGTILPITNGTISLTLDGYYFYGVSLLTRVNLTNTTVLGTYKNQKGFPLSVKSITLTTSDMKVSLQLDNQLSQKELDEIDEDYPEDDAGQHNGYANKVYSKYDILSRTYIQ